jgi:hypothetical protein
MSDQKDFKLPGVQVLMEDNFLDDPIIQKVHGRIFRMVAVDSKAPGSDVLSSTPVISGKKVKITQQIIEDSYKRLRVLISGKKVNAASITILVAYAMQLSDEMLSTDKRFKIELALIMLRKLIDDEVDDIVERVTLHLLVETTVPTLISTIHGLPGMLERLFKKCGCCNADQ